MFERLIQLIGQEKLDELQTKTVCIFGLGGVGGNAVEAIVRGGFQHIILVDKDTIDPSNINRQIIATHSSIGKRKVDVMKERILDINPNATVTTYPIFYNFDTKNQLWKHKIDYVIDCIDTITFKIDIIKECLHRDITFISVMGTGNKYHPNLLEILPLSKTEYDPIARVIRNKLKKEYKLNKIMTVISKEPQQKVDSTKQSPSSNSFVPSTAGILAASYIFNTQIGKIT